MFERKEVRAGPFPSERRIFRMRFGLGTLVLLVAFLLHFFLHSKSLVSNLTGFLGLGLQFWGLIPLYYGHRVAERH